MLASPAIAQTRAGTVITNIATLQVGSTDARPVVSNEVRLVTAERLDVVLTSPVTAPIVIAPSGTIVPIVLTNSGNGDEAFAVDARPGDPTVAVRAIAIDADGDGAFDPARDSVLVEGRAPSLAPGAALSLLVVLDPAANPITATGLVVSARADTGSGNPGTDFPGRGDGSGDASTGTTGAAAQLSLPIAPSDPDAPVLVKRQSVRAPDGSGRAVRGATITYEIEAHLPGAIASARLRDPIPAGTTYVADSLRLDAVPLTDAADADPGSIDSTGIAVVIGDVTAPATRTVQFQVIIQ